MKLKRREAWICCRMLGGREPVAPGSIEPLIESDRIAPLTSLFRDVDPRQRALAFKAFLAARTDREGWEKPILASDPNGPPPPEDDPEDIEPAATLDDLKRLVADTTWPWAGWISPGSLNTLASNAGEGKTILAMNLARALWHGTPWPDGSTNPFPARTPTLWIPGDRHYVQLIGLAEKYGLPGESMLFNAPPDEPTTGLNLDDPETLDRLERTIWRRKPGLVIVDTVVGATFRNLGAPDEANAFFGPLQTMAASSGVSFLLLTHLSKEKQALGRRIIGASRVVWQLAWPDKEGQPDRRKLWVDKTCSMVPSALGMTIAEDGCTFDDKPPQEAGEGARGKPRVSRLDQCRLWLIQFLGGQAKEYKVIMAAAREAGYKNNQLIYDAKEANGLVTIERDGAKYWGRPGTPFAEAEPGLF